VSQKVKCKKCKNLLKAIECVATNCIVIFVEIVISVFRLLQVVYAVLCNLLLSSFRQLFWRGQRCQCHLISRKHVNIAAVLGIWSVLRRGRVDIYNAVSRLAISARRCRNARPHFLRLVFCE